MSRATTTLLTALILAALPVLASAHCQVPCGIYDDAARFTAMLEDVTTIEKAMNKMSELAGSDDVRDRNQFARWVATKEQHAARIITVIAEYFLTQKMSLPPEGVDEADRRAYLDALAEHHAVLVAAMKCKQNADPKFATDLRRTLESLSRTYRIPPPHKH